MDYSLLIGFHFREVSSPCGSDVLTPNGDFWCSLELKFSLTMLSGVSYPIKICFGLNLQEVEIF